MSRSSRVDDLIAGLNDLLMLDHDAVSAYSVAIKLLNREDWVDDLVRFRRDHERHIRDLNGLVRSLGGVPVNIPHIPTGAFKTAVQAASGLGSDREVLLAFKANERQVRDKYGRAARAEEVPRDIRSVLERNAADEERHYNWVSEVLEGLGAGGRTRLGRMESRFEWVHGRAADLVEGAERRVVEQAGRAKRAISGRGRALGVGVLAAAGLGVLLFRRFRR